MIVMDGYSSYIAWNLDRANLKIKVSNPNSEPILRVEVLDLKQSLKLTALSKQVQVIGSEEHYLTNR
jgi:hypothetical protein